jgi:hypothetical protein
VLISKVKTLAKVLDESRNHLNKFDNGKLDDILSIQKFVCDKTGLGFDKFATSSSKSNSSPKKVVFVKATNEDEAAPKVTLLAPHQKQKNAKRMAIPIPKGMVGKQGKHSSLPRNNYHSHQRNSQCCHHYGRRGHLRPNCFLLNSQKNKTSLPRNDFGKLCAMMNNMMTRLDKLDIAPRVKKI